MNTHARDVSIKTVAVSCPVCDASEFDPWAKGLDFEYLTSRKEFRIVRCRHCGVLYLNPRPDITEFDRIYPGEYRAYHFEENILTFRFRNYLERRKVRLIAGLVPDSADLLDVGCGGAGFLERLKKFGSPGWRLWGNDISPAVIADLKNRGFKTLPGKFEDIVRFEEIFDAVILKQVLEHFGSPREILAKARKLLRQGGVVIIETPNFDAWDAFLFRKRCWSGYQIPRHWTIFNPLTLSRLGKQVGFDVEDISFIVSPSFWVESVRHSLLDRGLPPLIYNRFTHRNPVFMGMATMIDLLQKTVMGKTSNMRIILRRCA